MRKTPRILTAIVLTMPWLIAVIQWAVTAKQITNPGVLWLHDNASSATLGVATTMFFAAATKEILGAVGFRRDRIRKALDQFLAEQCGGDAKKHRLTVFKRQIGIVVLIVGAARLLRRGRSAGAKWVALSKIRWFSSYLYVYARATGARAPVSSAAFRVSDIPEECEGIAGQAWEQGFCI